VLLACLVAHGDDVDPDTRAGMDAEVRGDWVRAVEAFERANADGKDARAAARLREARDRATKILAAAVDALLDDKRFAAAANATAVGLVVNPGYHKFTGAQKRLEREGVAIPAVPADAAGPFAHRSAGSRLRCFARQGAAFGRAEEVVDRCLAFLLRQQDESGCWKAEKGGGKPQYDPGVTALAMLAFLSRGRDGLEGAAGDAVARAAAWLKSVQRKEGEFGSRSTVHFFYCTLFATEALAEYAVLTERVDEWRPTLESARDLIVGFQNPGRGWRYEPRGGENDTSMTGRAAEALHALENAGVSVPDATLAGAVAWVESMTDPVFGQVGYNLRGGAVARPEGLQNLFPAEHSQAMTASACLTRLHGGADVASLGLCFALLDETPPVAKYADRYYWEIGARAYQAGFGVIPQAWYDALVESAAAGLADDGAVTRAGTWSTDGGTYYSTAITALALAAPYREPPPARGAASAFLESGRRTLAGAGRAAEVPTGIYVDSGTVLDVTAEGGLAPLGKDGPGCAVDGIKKTPRGAKKIEGRYPFACLLGRVGPDGRPFRIDPDKKLRAPGAGQLYLLVNDDDTSNNAKGWNVTFVLAR